MSTSPAERQRATRWDVGRTQLWLMMALTFVTGVVDAVGYLGLDKVFTGNMTGNIVILAMGLVGSADLPVFGPLLALFSFAGGALLIGTILRGQGSGWCRRSTVLLGRVSQCGAPDDDGVQDGR
ncbi:YoaK family protein [Pseudarthrobacter sp. P1]|uniref:YoaK family protein n=1 Tax=Pseudarthrobacter sp. P1 TaxID=3418418 RepID=UPI003CE7A608